MGQEYVRGYEAGDVAREQIEPHLIVGASCGMAILLVHAYPLWSADS